MKKAEEILLPYHQTKDIDGNIMTGEAVWIEHALVAMSEYAKQQAVGFTKWKSEQDNQTTFYLTIEDQYALFLTEIYTQ